MGLMKRYLEEKIAEYAKLINTPEQEIYENDALYASAVKHAERMLANSGN